MKWQKIETAPKDGRKVIVVISVNDNYISDPWTVIWDSYHKTWARWPHDIWKPTHWMPLPPPPEDEK